MRNRFEITYSQNSFGSTIEILVDRETGINYIWRRSCNAGGLTPLLGTDGQPVISQEGESLKQISDTPPDVYKRQNIIRP